MYQLTRLPNGLTVATAEMSHMQSVSLGIWVNSGGRYESAELNGASHFIEHLLFKGTRRRSARRISQEVEGAGGYLNAFTAEEQTCFHARASHDRFDLVLDVLVDMLLHSKFDPAEVEKEREVIKEEWAMYRDQPAQYVQELLNATLWPDQPLGRPLTGTEQTLNRLKRDSLVKFHRNNYVARNTVIVVAGRVNHPQVLRAVSRFNQWFRDKPVPRFAPALTEQERPHVTWHKRDAEQTQLALGIRTCSRHDPRRFAVRLLSTLLAENTSARLFQLLREELALVYDIHSAASFLHDTGDLVLSVGLDADKLRRVLRLIVAELRRFTDKPPGRAELKRAIDYTISQTALSLESTENQMNWLGESVCGFGRIVRPAESLRRFAAVTPAEIRVAARDFFRADHLNLTLVTPLKRDDRLTPLLNL
jgi:predicted Zn-dependent peptidase